jgi:hypothetical protein
VYKVFAAKPEGKLPLGRLKHRWEDGIRMAIREIGWGGGWSGFSWLWIGTCGKLFITVQLAVVLSCSTTQPLCKPKKVHGQPLAIVTCQVNPFFEIYVCGVKKLQILAPWC